MLSRYEKVYKIIGFQGDSNVRLRSLNGKLRPRSVSINKIKRLQVRRPFQRLPISVVKKIDTPNIRNIPQKQSTPSHNTQTRSQLVKHTPRDKDADMKHPPLDTTVTTSPHRCSGRLRKRPKQLHVKPVKHINKQITDKI